jgi:hypothetical protein
MRISVSVTPVVLAGIELRSAVADDVVAVCPDDPLVAVEPPGEPPDDVPDT